MAEGKQKIALVLGTVPSIDDIDQFRLLSETYELTVISGQSIIGYISQMSYFQNLTCLGLPDYDDSPTYMPGLEKVLADFSVVIVKERLGLYAYQCVKAKWKYRFRLIVWIDNLRSFAGHDHKDMNVIRTEVTNAADGFLVQSDAATATLTLEGVEESRIVKVRPWVEAHVDRSKKNRAKAREELGLAESSFVIAHLGDIEWEEGLSDLVSAVKLAIKERPSLKDKIKIVFCGIGSYASELRDSFLRLDMDELATYIQPNRRSYEAIQLATDAIFIGTLPSRDRTDGDPYRILRAMVNQVPILSCRTPMIEELCGKHRIDYCLGSPHSLAQAVLKLEKSDSLVSDIVKKNAHTIQERYNEDACRKDLADAMEKLGGLTRTAGESDIDHLVLEAEARVSSKQYLDAIDIIETTFKRSDIPTHHKSNLYRLIGDCFAKLGDNEGAKDAYIQAAELDPFSAKAYIGLGTVGLVKNSCDIAVLHFQKAVSLAPEDEMANLGLGLAFHGMEERKEARRWVCKALSINPSNTVGIYTLVKLSHELEDYEDAEKSLLRYIDLHPNDYNMVYTLAGIYSKVGRHKDALELSEKILAVDPMDKRAQGLANQARRLLEESSASSSGSNG